MRAVTDPLRCGLVRCGAQTDARKKKVDAEKEVGFVEKKIEKQKRVTASADDVKAKIE